MPSEQFQKLITAYHEKSYKNWFFISISLFITLITALTSITVYKFLLSCTLQAEYENLQAHMAELKNISGSHKKLVKEHKELEKQSTIFVVHSFAQVLSAISHAIPADTFLTSITIHEQIQLEGFAPDLHELALFSTKLAEQKLRDVAIAQSDAQSGSFHFTIKALLS